MNISQLEEKKCFRVLENADEHKNIYGKSNGNKIGK